MAERVKVQAWQKREMEQSALMERLSNMMFEAAEKFSEQGDESLDADRFFMLAGHYILAQMIAAHGGEYCHPIGNSLVEMNFVGQWVRKALAEIDKFSRAPAETNLLRAKLMKYLVEEGTKQIRWAYGDLETRGQKTLYDGHKSTDEVEMPVFGEAEAHA